MKKTIQIITMASLLMTGAATAMAANDGGGGVGSRGVTGTQTGSQQTNIPATGSALGATSNQTAPTYPATVGPTGSRRRRKMMRPSVTVAAIAGAIGYAFAMFIARHQ
jgi:hypothetical protein